MAETAANKELAERLPRLTGDDLKEKYPFWEDALSGWSCVSGWAEMEGFLSRPLNQACQHVESMSKPRKTAKEHVALTDLPERLLSWLYGSVGGSATRDFPCRSGGEAMETRYHLLRALVKLQDSNPDVFQELGEGIHALDHLESCSAESLAKVGSAMRDLVWQQLREDVEEEKRKGNPRVVTVQMIQPVREGLKERLFELHAMASQFLTRPAVHFLQKGVIRDKCHSGLHGSAGRSRCHGTKILTHTLHCLPRGLRRLCVELSLRERLSRKGLIFLRLRGALGARGLLSVGNSLP